MADRLSLRAMPTKNTLPPHCVFLLINNNYCLLNFYSMSSTRPLRICFLI